jgi:hypothetical protein
MAWTDDHAPEHEKFLALNDDAAVALWWRALCYANRQRKGGFIPTVALRLLSLADQPAAVAQKLVDVRLWETAPGGYRVHDFVQGAPGHAAERQPETALTASGGGLSEARREAGRRGGQASAEARRASKQPSKPKQTGKQHPSKPGSNIQANDQQNQASPRPVSTASRASDLLLDSERSSGSASGSEISCSTLSAAAPSGEPRESGSSKTCFAVQAKQEQDGHPPTSRSPVAAPVSPPRPAPLPPRAPAPDQGPEDRGAKYLPRVGVDIMAPFAPPPLDADPQGVIRDVLRRQVRPISYLADTRTPELLHAVMMPAARSVLEVANGIDAAVSNLPGDLALASPEDPALMSRLHSFVAKCVRNELAKPRTKQRETSPDRIAQAAWVLGTFSEEWRKAKGEAYPRGDKDIELAADVVTFLRVQVAEAQLAHKGKKAFDSQQVAKAWLAHKIDGYLSDDYFTKPNHPFAMLAAILKDKPSRWGAPSPTRTKWESLDPVALAEAREPVKRLLPMTAEQIAEQQAAMDRITAEHFVKHGGGPAGLVPVSRKTREEQLRELARIDEEDRAEHPDRYVEAAS